MAESTPPKLPMVDDNLSSPRFRASNNLMRRGWLCLGEQTIAAYIDNALGHAKKTRVEGHLAKCERCRHVVAEIVKLQRVVDLSVPPIEVTPAHVRSAPAAFAFCRWLWAPTGAIAVVIFVVCSLWVVRQPRDLLILPPQPPSAPTVAKAQSVNPPGRPLSELVREPAVREARPVLLSPVEGSTVAREHLEFNWKPVSHSRYYEVRVVTGDGDLRWKGRTMESALPLPSHVDLRSGSYFVWIPAYHTDGSISRSTPVRFLLKR